MNNPLVEQVSEKRDEGGNGMLVLALIVVLERQNGSGNQQLADLRELGVDDGDAARVHGCVHAVGCGCLEEALDQHPSHPDKVHLGEQVPNQRLDRVNIQAVDHAVDRPPLLLPRLLLPAHPQLLLIQIQGVTRCRPVVGARRRFVISFLLFDILHVGIQICRLLFFSRFLPLK